MQDHAYTMTRLEQRNPITVPVLSTVENPIPAKELISRLRKISEHLLSVESLDNPQHYVKLAHDLANKKLLKHQNLGVRVHACCAISDILRLFIPDAPFSPSSMATIFEAAFALFAHLWDEHGAYQRQLTYLIKRLLDIHCMALVADLQEAPSLVTQLFQNLYAVAAKGCPSQLESAATQMLVEAVSEVDVVPKSVVLQIVQSFTESDESSASEGRKSTHGRTSSRQTTLTSDQSYISNTAFNFAIAICEINSDKMSRQLVQLYSEILDDGTRATSDGDVDYESSFLALEKIHTWSVRIWKLVPGLLVSVMGLINDELDSDSQEVRVLATSTISAMLAADSGVNGENSATRFHSAYPNTWLAWLKKASDVSPEVRRKWHELVLPIVVGQRTMSEITVPICDAMVNGLLDTDESVRLAVCEAFALFPFSVFTSRVCTASALTNFFTLCREKNTGIRTLCVNFLASIYDAYCSVEPHEVDFGTKTEESVDELKRLISRNLPNTLMHLAYINDLAINALVDVVLLEKLVHFELDAELRVLRLCRFFDALDGRSVAVIKAFLRRQVLYSDAVSKFASLCEQRDDTGSDKKNLSEKAAKAVGFFASALPEGMNGHKNLERLLELHNVRFIVLMKNCLNKDADYNTIKNSIKEMLIKLADSKTFKSFSGHLTELMVSTVKLILYRSSNILFNRENVGELIGISTTNPMLKSPAELLLGLLSAVFPDGFRFHSQALAKAVINQGNGVDIAYLQSLYSLVKKYPEEYIQDGAFSDALISIALSNNPARVKLSVKFLKTAPKKEDLAKELVERLKPISSQSGCGVVALAELYSVDDSALKEHAEEINRLVIDGILRDNRHSVELNDYLDWVEDSDLLKPEFSPLLEKLAAIRLIVNKLRNYAHREVSPEVLSRSCEKRLKLLTSVILSGGEIVNRRSGAQATPPAFCERLRLAAGLGLLKLAKIPCFNPLIDAKIIMALKKLVEDPCTKISLAIVTLIEKRLTAKLISERFLHLMFFVDNQKSSIVTSTATTWILSRHKACVSKRDICFEKTLARIVHTISHDESFVKLASEETHEKLVEAYNQASNYLQNFANYVASDDNISLLYYIASRVRQYRDVLVDANSDSRNLYRAAELAQLVLKVMADSKKWMIETWPGKLDLGSDIFSPIEDYNEAQKVMSTVFIPDSIQVEVIQNMRDSERKKISKRKPPKPSQRKIRAGPKTKAPSLPKGKKRESLGESTPIGSRNMRKRQKVKYVEESDSEIEDEESQEPLASDEESDF